MRENNFSYRTDDRLFRLRKRLKKEGLEAFIVTEPHNVFYLTGTWAEGVILLTSSDRFFITSRLYEEEAKKELSGWQVVIRKEALEKAIGKILTRVEASKIGFEASHLSYRQYKRLIELVGRRLVPCTGLVEDLRLVKDEEELSCIRKATRVTELAFDHLKGLLKVGITEKEVSAEAIYFIRKMADKESFPPIVLFGERTSLPHGRPGERKLKKGDLVLFDLGAMVEGYCADLTRTFFFGQVEERWHKIRDLLRQAQEEAINSVRPGVKSSRIDRIIRQRLKEEGYVFIHNTGHGVGLEVHEEPNISPDSKRILREGMVFTIEPGVYFPGEGGVRVERMLLVTQNGGEVLDDYRQ